MNISYEEAVNEPGLRQEFLNSVDLGEAKQYISKAVYKGKPCLSDSFGTDKAGFICKVPLKTFLGFQGIKSKVIVYPISFSFQYHANQDDFFSSLIDHEGAHAREFFFNTAAGRVRISDFPKLGLVDKNNVSDFEKKLDSIELLAIENQIANFPKRRCSQEYVEETRLEYEHLVRTLGKSNL